MELIFINLGFLLFLLVFCCRLFKLFLFFVVIFFLGILYFDLNNSGFFLIFNLFLDFIGLGDIFFFIFIFLIILVFFGDFFFLEEWCFFEIGDFDFFFKRGDLFFFFF